MQKQLLGIEPFSALRRCCPVLYSTVLNSAAPDPAEWRFVWLSRLENLTNTFRHFRKTCAPLFDPLNPIFAELQHALIADGGQFATDCTYSTEEREDEMWSKESPEKAIAKAMGLETPKQKFNVTDRETNTFQIKVAAVDQPCIAPWCIGSSVQGAEN